MKRISSSATAFHKMAPPIFGAGFLATCLVLVIASGATPKGLVFLVVLIGMGAVGFVFIKELVWDLVDEVWDCGEYLTVRNGGDEDQIAFADIERVSFMPSTPPRITLALVRPCKFGPRIMFSPATANPFAPDTVAEDLTRRTHRARTERIH